MPRPTRDPGGPGRLSRTGLSPPAAGLSRPFRDRRPAPTRRSHDPGAHAPRFGLARFRSPLLARSNSLPPPPGTEMFHFPGCRRPAVFDSGGAGRPRGRPGCPIRVPADHGALAPPRGLSRLAAPFVAMLRQGIRRAPVCAWPSGGRGPRGRAPVRSPSLSALRRPGAEAPGAFFQCSLDMLPDCAAVKDRPPPPPGARGKPFRRRPPPPAAGVVGVPGVGPGTSSLSGTRSNQLSYTPGGGGSRARTGDVQLAKLALYRLSYAPVRALRASGGAPARRPRGIGAELAGMGRRGSTFGRPRGAASPQKGGDPTAGSPTVTLLRLHPNHHPHLRRLAAASGADGFHDVTGGVYKARERIHGAVADAPLLANPASRGRVADPDPNWGAPWGLAGPRGPAALCARHCSTCAALGVRAILT